MRYIEMSSPGTFRGLGLDSRVAVEKQRPAVETSTAGPECRTASLEAKNAFYRRLHKARSARSLSCPFRRSAARRARMRSTSIG